MRILAIRGANIASLTEFDVNFAAEPLRSAGIFAIVGPTGAGKSSLLDAMCLALYQKAPRLDDLTGRETKVESRFGVIGQSDIRNLLRRGCDTGHAECDFRGGDGKAYRARWGYRAPRKKGAQVQEEMTLVCLDDQRVLVAASGKKGEYQAAIERLVGLKYDEFMRTVLLAQGRFAEFLRSDENQRADLLEKLTGTGIYTRISKRIFERTKTVRSAVELLQRDLGNLEVLDDAVLAEKTAQARDLEAERPRLEDRSARVRGLREALGRRDAMRSRREVLRRDLEAARARLAAHETAMGEARRKLSDAEAARGGAQEGIAKARALDARLLAAGKLLEQAEAATATSRKALDELEARHRELISRRGELERRIVADREWAEKMRPKFGALADRWPLWQDRLAQADRLRAEVEDAGKRISASAKNLSAGESEREKFGQELSSLEVDADLEAAAVHADLARLAARRGELQAALPWLELRAEIASLEARIAEGKERLAEREAVLPGREAAWELARRLLQDTRATLSGGVVHLRTSLVEGEPCPVCGAVEHPWTQTAPAFDALLSRHEEEEARARAELDQARSERDGARGALATLESAERAARERFEGLSVSADLLAEYAEASDPTEHLRALLGRTEGREREALSLLQALQERDRRRSRLAELDARLESLREAHEGERAHAEKSTVALEECLASLDGVIATEDWRAKWRVNPAFAAEVGKFVETYLARTRSLDAMEREREPLAASAASLEETIRAKTAEWTASSEATAKARVEREGWEAERKVLLDGRPVDEIESALEKAVAVARKADAEARASQAKDLEAVAALEGAQRQLDDQEGEEEHRIAELSKDLFGELANATDSVDLEMRAGELAQTLEERRSEAARILAVLSVELARDKENRAKGEKLAREKKDREADLAQWSLLCDQVGSADGVLFRRIAQQFTLEGLLDEANAQLASVAPRYSLRMLGNSMHFGVLDHESYDELRPVQTLSGGESFLVSLALALGLSRLAGGDLVVESLFIDEGFGTLDGETLQGVMTALSALHAQGRKVGLITHVEEMKEQIPVRIEVVRMGQGTSRVEVRG